MTLTEEDKQRAIQLYMNRQACNSKYDEKRKEQMNKEGDEAQTNKRGRKAQPPTEEQLHQLLLKTKEKSKRKVVDEIVVYFPLT